MDRRDVLKLGALASVGGSGCASLLTNPGAVTAGEMDGFLASLDSSLQSVASGKFFDKFLPSTMTPEVAARAQHGEELTKKTFRSLLLVGTLQELPAEHLSHEGVQQRLRNQMGEFDDAVFGMTSMLEGLSPSERASVSTALRDDPQLGMRIMGAVDQDAASFGVSLKQRTKLRALSAQACARLRQSPDLAIAEYTGKVHKVVARHGARAERERRASASIGSALLWQQQGGDASGGTVGGESGRGLSAPPPPPTELPEEPTRSGPTNACTFDADCAPGSTCDGYKNLGDGKWSKGTCVAPADVKKKPKSSPGILTAGGIIMGLGLTTFGIGALTGSNGLLIGATVGAILGVIGLVVLIIGLVVLATGN